MILENVDIRKYCTLKVGGQFRYFVEAKSIDDIHKAYQFSKEKDVKVLILGGGSNMVFPDGILNVLALKIEILGFDILSDTKEFTEIKVCSGENWDYFVERTVDMRLSGVEALSAIPGTVGATPVQNVGAYGQEVKDTILSVEVFDTKEKEVKILSNDDCDFSYRNSIFKDKEKGRYIILSVVFKLLKRNPEIPNYSGVKKYFEERNNLNPSLKEIREAIIKIRSNKLPNPNEIPNVGSFFKNPIITKKQFDEICKDNKDFDIPVFELENDFVKIPAGWLIENTGLKGKDFGHISTYKNNALVFVNDGEATFKDIISARDEIIKKVYEKFSITLETEPEFVK